MESSAWVILVRKFGEEKEYFLTNSTKGPDYVGVSSNAKSAKIYRKKLRAQFMCDQINDLKRYQARINEVMINGAIKLV